MRKQLFALAIVIGAGFAAPAIAQLHVAAASNPAPSLKNPAVAAPAPVLPDAAKVVTKADAEAFADAEFAFADSDKSLNLTKAEFAALVKARDDKAKEMAAKSAATAPTPAASDAATTAAPPAPKTAEIQFADIAGKATQIDRTKFVEARLAAYAAADLDADGALTAHESQKFADLVAGKSAL